MSKWQHLIDKHRASLDAAKGIFTWTNEEELAWLAEEASKRFSVLEIGTYAGHSAKVMATAMRLASGIMLPKRLVCFDYTPDRPPDAGVAVQALKNLTDEIQRNQVEYYQRDAGVSAVHWLLGDGRKFDMIWIDDGHTYADVVRDCLIAVATHKDDDSLICGHDYERPFNDVARAVNDCFGEKNIKFGPGTIWYL